MDSPEPPGRRRRLPPAKPQAPSVTTIHDLGDDLLLRIFLHLPSLPSLVRAAFTCRAFLAAVRSSPAFRRRFHELHAPPLLGLFLNPSATDVRSYAPLRRRSDPDFTAAVRASDFLIAGVPDEIKEVLFECRVADCRGGYVLFDRWLTRRMVAYNPLTRAFDLFPAPFDEIVGRRYHYLGHHMVSSDESSGSFRVVSIFSEGSMFRRDLKLRVAIFSSGTREWQILPWTTEAPEQEPWRDQLGTGALVQGSLYRSHVKEDCILVLNMATLQFSWMDLPDQLKGKENIYRIGESKDGHLCLVSTMELTLLTWLRRTNADGVENWMLDNVIQLEREVLSAVEGTPEDVGVLEVSEILDGIVYLLTRTTGGSNCWFLSFCLETRKLEKITEKYFGKFVYPYIMSWPPSLVGNGMSA